MNTAEQLHEEYKCIVALQGVASKAADIAGKAYRKQAIQEAHELEEVTA